MTGRIPLWVDLRSIPINKRLPFLHALDEVAAERVLLAREDPHTDRKGIDVVVVDGRNHLKRAGQHVGRLIQVSDAKGQEKAAGADGIVVVDASDWRIIPFENLIAARREKPGTLYALARTPAQAALAAETLETGVHGVVLAPATTSDIFATDQALRARYRPSQRSPLTTPRASSTTANPSGGVPLPSPDPSSNGSSPTILESPSTSPHLAGASTTTPETAVRQAPSPNPAFLEPATILSVEDGGMGDRVCIDTTSLFRDGEGLLVGSTAASFLLVHAETLETEFVRARPFRVNAGAIHMYLFAPDGKTRYLSELRAGDPVLAIHPDGIHRVLTIGRAKIERRPHVLVRWQGADGRVASAVLQNAETIRLVRHDGRPVPVTDLRRDDVILVHNEGAARHAGMPIDESLEER